MRVVIAGAGLSGLACARELHRQGASVRVFEANEYVGGRASTEATSEGFLLDRGFQVLLTAYPEARRIFNYQALGLGCFLPGAIVRWGGRFHHLADPVRAPQLLLPTLTAPIGSLADKARVARLWLESHRSHFGDFSAPECSTLAALHRRGFSDQFIARFFRPFLGGIFLESELATSDRMFEFVFRMFARGHAALPAGGMGALAGALRSELPGDMVTLGQSVTALIPGGVRLATGEEVAADRVVVATDGSTAAALIPGRPASPMRGVYNLYFSASRSPLSEPMLVLNGEGRGIVNNLAVPSDIAPSYAPAGAALISVSVLESSAGERTPGELEGFVRDELREWFGADVREWRYLRGFHIVRALPTQPASLCSSGTGRSTPELHIEQCGDYLLHGSIEGALSSGRRTAERILGAGGSP